MASRIRCSRLRLTLLGALVALAFAPLGILSVLDGGVVSAGSRWQPTQPLSLLGSNLGSALWATWVQLRSRPIGDTTLAIDDVYVDPWVIR